MEDALNGMNAPRHGPLVAANGETKEIIVLQSKRQISLCFEL